MSLIIKLWNKSPADIVNFLKKKFIYKSDYNYSTSSVLNDKKHMNPSILIDRWSRYLRVINANIENSKFVSDVKDKNVFELGCGPLLGWGPLLIFLGAKSFSYYEPNLRKQTIMSDKIKNKYFYELYSELVSNYGKIMEFNIFYKLIFEKSIPIDFNGNKYIDISISNSVLEHIPRKEISDSLSKVFNVMRDDATFMHVVDHSPHSAFDTSLMSFYRYGKNKKHEGVNLLRKNEMKDILIGSGFVNFIDYVYRKETVDIKKIHNSWTHFNIEDLEAKTVFYVST